MCFFYILILEYKNIYSFLGIYFFCSFFIPRLENTYILTFWIDFFYTFIYIILSRIKSIFVKIKKGIKNIPHLEDRVFFFIPFFFIFRKKKGYFFFYIP